MASLSTEWLPRGSVLVTGAHGFLGQSLLRLFAQEDVTAVCPSHNEHPPGLPGHHVRLDIRETEDLALLMRQVDAVIHLAAVTGGIQLQQAQQVEILYLNQKLTSSTFLAAARAGVQRVVLASSAVVYRTPYQGAIPESAPLLDVGSPALSGYALSKIIDEHALRWFMDDGAFEGIIGRLTNVYGPNGPFESRRSTVIHDMVRKAFESRNRKLEVWGDGTAVRSFIYESDAAEAIGAILERGESGLVYNIDSAEAVTVAEVADLVRRAINPDINIVFNPDRLIGERERVLDNERLRSLGFNPKVDLQTGIAATVAGYRRRVKQGKS